MFVGVCLMFVNDGRPVVTRVTPPLAQCLAVIASNFLLQPSSIFFLAVLLGLYPT